MSLMKNYCIPFGLWFFKKMLLLSALNFQDGTGNECENKYNETTKFPGFDWSERDVSLSTGSVKKCDRQDLKEIPIFPRDTGLPF